MSAGARATYVAKKQSVVDQLDQANREGRRIIYLDEICFTKLSIQNREWSLKGQNMKVPQKEVMNGYKAVLAAISYERGLEEITMHDIAIKTDTFIEYL